MGAVDVGGETHEGHGDDVGASADSPTQIGFILLGQSRQRHGNARQVDALVAGNRPGNDDLGVHVVAFDLGDLKTNLAVIDENRIASMAIARQALERGGSDMLVALDVVGGDDELLAFGQLDLVFTVGVLLEPTATDLRTLQINQGCDVAAGGLGGGAEVVVDLEVVFRSAVGAVQTSNVHTCFDKAGDAFQGLGSWTDGIYDLALRMNACLFLLILILDLTTCFQPTSLLAKSAHFHPETRRVVSAHIFLIKRNRMFPCGFSNRHFSFASMARIFSTLANAAPPIATTITAKDSHVGTSGTQAIG